jgi:catechol 2,3-dioxygenase-like lactoylglutathione lyase family enzyme
MSALDFWHHHVGVSVPDLEASVEWYRRVLGFVPVRRLRIESIPADVAILKHGAMHIELFQAAGAKPLPAERREPDSDVRTHGNKHIAFAIADVEPFAAELRRRGADVVWVKHFEHGGANIFIRDNGGNLIEFLQAPQDPQLSASLDSRD